MNGITYGFPPGPKFPFAVTPFVGGGPGGGGLGAARGSCPGGCKVDNGTIISILQSTHQNHNRSYIKEN